MISVCITLVVSADEFLFISDHENQSLHDISFVEFSGPGLSDERVKEFGKHDVVVTPPLLVVASENVFPFSNEAPVKSGGTGDRLPSGDNRLPYPCNTASCFLNSVPSANGMAR